MRKNVVFITILALIFILSSCSFKEIINNHEDFNIQTEDVKEKVQFQFNAQDYIKGNLDKKDRTFAVKNTDFTLKKVESTMNEKTLRFELTHHIADEGTLILPNDYSFSEKDDTITSSSPFFGEIWMDGKKATLEQIGSSNRNITFTMKTTLQNADNVKVQFKRLQRFHYSRDK
ncbi:hypothetical protein [Salibacterium sp. K-3]